MRVLALDFESSIGKTVHGSTFRDKENDIFTQIWASHPDKVNVMHDAGGFGRRLIPSLKEYDLLIGHNNSFDLCYIWQDEELQEFILRGGRIWDTQTVEYILTAQQHSTSSLSELQLKYLGEVEKPSLITKLYKAGIGADKIVQSFTRCKRLRRVYEEYCRTDGSTPLKIFKAQYLRAKKQNMLAIVELYNDYLLAIINMTCTGVDVDVEKAELLKREFLIKSLELAQKAVEILKEVWTDPRLPEFKITSNDHKSVVLFGGDVKIKEKVQNGFFKNGNPKMKTIEVPIRVRGFGLKTSFSKEAKKEGFYSTDRKVMENIAADASTPARVIEYCKLQEESAKLQKAANTYCQAIIDRNVDGVLYPNFNNTITPTGRLTSSEPNMQNLPSKGDLAEEIMGLWVAPEGWVCVSADYSQLEKWVQALVTEDMNLRELLEKGVCLHCMTLSKIEGLDYDYVYRKAKIEEDPVWDKKRTNIKPVGFQMDYGAMPKSVVRTTGMPLNEVEEIYRVDKELYPDKHNFFDVILPECVNKSVTFSLAENIPANKKKGKRGLEYAGILGKAELLPIFDSGGEVSYNKQEIRKVGYWQTNYGKKYHFLDSGRESKYGIRRNFRMPTFKNYPNQGGAADVQGSTTAELLKVLVKAKDKIKMVNEIHDSKLFYIRADVLDNCIKFLKEIMEDVPKIFRRRFNIDVPFRFPIEFKTGKTFGTMTKYKSGENV